MRIIKFLTVCIEIDYIQYFAAKDEVNINFGTISNETRFYPVLSKIVNFVKKEWPYYTKKERIILEIITFEETQFFYGITV